MKRIVTRIGLLLGISAAIAGCAANCHLPPKPPRPHLIVQPNPRSPGGICLDRENTEKLLDYIYSLEEGYEALP